MKKFAMFAVAAMFTLSFATGCQKQEAPKQEGVQTAPAEGTAAPAAPAAPAEQGTTGGSH